MARYIQRPAWSFRPGGRRQQRWAAAVPLVLLLVLVSLASRCVGIPGAAHPLGAAAAGPGSPAPPQVAPGSGPARSGSPSVAVAADHPARREGRQRAGRLMAASSSASVLGRWPQLMATGPRLGRPAPATGAATPGSWLGRFMSGATVRGLRVGGTAPHWYGCDSRPDAVRRLSRYPQATYDPYHRPAGMTPVSGTKSR
jgi:hypothetical protein